VLLDITRRKAVGWLLLADILQAEVGSHFLSEFVRWAPGQARIDWLLSLFDDLGLRDCR